LALRTRSAMRLNLTELRSSHLRARPGQPGTVEDTFARVPPIVQSTKSICAIAFGWNSRIGARHFQIGLQRAMETGWRPPPPARGLARISQADAPRIQDLFKWDLAARFCSAGVPPAVLWCGRNPKTAGGTPALPNPRPARKHVTTDPATRIAGKYQGLARYAHGF
jgi:hypothetical protein